jgi:hypothetical protein
VGEDLVDPGLYRRVVEQGHENDSMGARLSALTRGDNAPRKGNAMSEYLTLGAAAERLGITRTEVRESRRFTIINDTRGAKVLEADVARVERQREDAQRNEEKHVIERPVNLAAKITEEEAWLASIRAQGGIGLALDDKEAQLERDKAELERLEAEATQMRIARAGGEDYARSLIEYDQWLKEMRAQGRSWRGQEESERKVREELAGFAA